MLTWSGSFANELDHGGSLSSSRLPENFGREHCRIGTLEGESIDRRSWRRDKILQAWLCCRVLERLMLGWGAEERDGCGGRGASKLCRLCGKSRCSVAE